MMGKKVTIAVDISGRAEIVFNDKDGKVNVLSSEVMEDLEKIIDKAAAEESIKVLLIKSAKPGIFIAGADINEIKDIKTKEEALEKSAKGQEILNKIERLKFPTIAVINGACLGGGFELALAAKFRIITDNKKVMLGLPETSLGLIPGFGGTVRLPKTAGLMEGLGMILAGKIIDGVKAYKIKIADAYYPEAFLEEKTDEFIKDILNPKKRKLILKKRKIRTFREKILEGNPFGRMLVFKKAKKELIKKTRSFYPAPVKALLTIKKSYGQSLKKALRLEQKSFSEIAAGDISKKLIRIFFLNEKLKKGLTEGESSAKYMIESGAVLGAGKMGGAIAWLFSNFDIPVRMKDISWNAVTSGFKAVNDIYQELKKIKKLDSREINLKVHMISGTIDYSGFSKADVVIEAIVEDKEIKIKTLNEIEKIVGKDTIIATNTSSYSVEELSSGLKRPERFIGFHFFNPVNRMPLVEIVKGKKSSKAALEKMFELAKRLKKIPVVVKDCNGFLVNRILMAYLNESVIMMSEGVDFTLIDRVIYNFGFPMGPFALLDEIGIKVGYKVAKILHSAYPVRSEIVAVFSEIAKEEELTGRSGGKGFYLYGKKGKKPNDRIYSILEENRIKKNYKMSEKEILERALARMINEAALCLEEKISEEPGFIDMALILGIGFPPFRGGILSYADDIGIEKTVDDLKRFEVLYGERFKTAELLLKMKKKKERFYL